MKLQTKGMPNKLFTGFSVLFLLFSVFLTMLLLSQITVYSDDYCFGTFFEYGADTFCTNTADHYLHANGRILVHFLLELTLLGDIWIYFILCPVVVCLCGFFLLRIGAAKPSFSDTCLMMAITLLLLVGLRTEILQTSLLWMSGSFNFILPMIFVLTAVFFYERDLQRGTVGAAAVIFSFLAGATTEQYGFFSCIALWGMWIMVLIRREKSYRRISLPPLFAVVGYLTVLTAPGMWGRVNAETTGFWSFFEPEILHTRFEDVASLLFGFDGCGTLIVLFCLVSASLVFASRSYPKILCLGYPVALLIALLNGTRIYDAGIVFFLYLVFVSVVLILKKDHTTEGCLLLGSIGTQILLLITSVYGLRTASPLIFTVILFTGRFCYEILHDRSLVLHLLVLIFVLIFSLYHFIPTFQGYAEAKTTIDRNLNAIEKGKENGEIHLDLDVDRIYGYTPFYEDGYFYQSFLRYYHIDTEKTTVCLEGENYPPLDLNGKQSPLPCVYNGDDVYLPLNSLVSAFGGKITKDGDDYRIVFPELNLWLASVDGDYGLYADAECKTLIVAEDHVLPSLCGFVYLESEWAESLFGLSVTYDESRDVYQVTKEQ